MVHPWVIQCYVGWAVLNLHVEPTTTIMLTWLAVFEIGRITLSLLLAFKQLPHKTDFQLLSHTVGFLTRKKPPNCVVQKSINGKLNQVLLNCDVHSIKCHCRLSPALMYFWGIQSYAYATSIWRAAKETVCFDFDVLITPSTDDFKSTQFWSPTDGVNVP